MKQRLELLRDENEYLTKDIAEKLNVVPSVYSEWENEKAPIPTRRIYQLANIYKINIDYLIGLSNIRKNIESSNEINIKVVSSRIKEVRKSLNFSMRELAKKLNTTSSAISNYENEKNLIISQFLIELCKISNYSIDYVLGRTDSKFLK